MKLQFVRICDFQSFGAEPEIVDLSDLTFLIGPNGSGKTATLQALCRLFSFDPNQRRLRKSDFFVPHDETQVLDQRILWIEAEMGASTAVLICFLPTPPFGNPRSQGDFASVLSLADVGASTLNRSH